jgi:hypothetical protein
MSLQGNRSVVSVAVGKVDNQQAIAVYMKENFNIAFE